MRSAIWMIGIIICGCVSNDGNSRGENAAPLVNHDLHKNIDGEQKMSQLSDAILTFDANASDIAKRMGPAALPELEHLMQDEDSAVRVETVEVLAALDSSESFKLVFQAVNDEDSNVVGAAVYQIEMHAARFPTPLLIRLMQKLDNPNFKKRLILLLGNRLDISESSTLEPYCTVEQDKIVAVACMAALAKLGVQQRREQFSTYLLSLKNDPVEFNVMFDLIDYIHQPWIVPSLGRLLNDKSEVQSLGDSLPGFPSRLRVCDKAVPLIADILQVEFTFRTDLHTNYTELQLQEVAQTLSNN